MKVLVIGYYNQGNLGDDAYQGVMGQFFPEHELTFVSSDQIKTLTSKKYQAIIVGGGDIINDYFHRTIKPFLLAFRGPKIAFSIGIPFPSLINDDYLGYFDHIFTRNYEDLQAIQRVVGSHRVHFIPDIALNYQSSLLYQPVLRSSDSSVGSRSESRVSSRISSDTPGDKKCGLFLIGNLARFPNIVDDLAHLVSKMALTHNVIIYCFDAKEDAALAIQVRTMAINRLVNSQTTNPRLKSLLKDARDTTRIMIDSNIYTAQQMIDKIALLDFGICLRYHAHIFCTVAGTPFVSISSTRKTRSFMKQAGLTDYQYEITLDGYGTPISSNYDTMRDCCGKAIRDRNYIKQRLGHFLDQSRFLLSSRQANRLLSADALDPSACALKFIEETGDHQNGARLLSKQIIGHPDTPYVWGMFEKFKHAGETLLEVIHDSIDFLRQEKDKFISDLDASGSTTLPLYVDLQEYQSYKSVHRGGWYVVCEDLAKLNSKNVHGEPNGLICDMYVDRTFHWAHGYMKYLGVIPYTSPWCGFIHHTPDTTYSEYNTTALFENPEFIQSLHTCRALFVLSEPLAKYLRTKLNLLAPHVQIITFSHPVVTPTKVFNYPTLVKNRDPMLINIGAWMRNPFTIYRLPDTGFQKTVLIGKDMSGYIPPENFSIQYYDGPEVKLAEISASTGTPCRPSTITKWIEALIAWLKSLNIHVSHYMDGVVYIRNKSQVGELNRRVQTMISKVKLLDYQTNDDYDNLLSRNVVFLDLVDAAAVNTIIECIVRQTPVVVNKIPGTVSLLGENYPLYYRKIEDIPKLLTGDQIRNATQYMKRLDTKRYQIRFFLNQMRDISAKLT